MVMTPPILVISLRTLGYHNQTTLDFINHSKTDYGKITAEDISANKKHIQTHWHPTLSPLEIFWEQHKDGKEFISTHSKAKITDDCLILYAIENLWMAFCQQNYPASCSLQSHAVWACTSLHPQGCEAC